MIWGLGEIYVYFPFIVFLSAKNQEVFEYIPENYSYLDHGENVVDISSEGNEFNHRFLFKMDFIDEKIRMDDGYDSHEDHSFPGNYFYNRKFI